MRTAVCLKSKILQPHLCWPCVCLFHVPHCLFHVHSFSCGCVWQGPCRRREHQKFPTGKLSKTALMMTPQQLNRYMSSLPQIYFGDLLEMERLAFQINAVLLSFENPGGIFVYILYLSTRELGSTTTFNIDSNKKCFLNANQHIQMIPESDFWNSEHVYMQISNLTTQISYVDMTSSINQVISL